MSLKIPENVITVLDTLEKKGFEAYIVGGCVRDILLGKVPGDYDVTTNALPDDVTAIFEKTAATGIQHGTVTVIINHCGIEVTTFRVDGGYTDSRRPDSVRFVSRLRDDLSRRDFTVNALAYNPKSGIQDYFSGREDLEKRILRAVGEPEKRFSEDALRILRLFRFASVLGFSIDGDTLAAALKCAPLIEKISVERLLTELEKGVDGDGCEAFIPLLCSGALSYTGITRGGALELIGQLPKNHNLRLYTFFYFCSDNPVAALQSLKPGNKALEYFKKMDVLIHCGLPETTYDCKKIMRHCPPDILSDRFIFSELVEKRDASAQAEMLSEILLSQDAYLINHLRIRGNEIAKSGLSGAQIGEAQEFLLENVLRQPGLNTPEKLKELLNGFIGN